MKSARICLTRLLFGAFATALVAFGGTWNPSGARAAPPGFPHSSEVNAASSVIDSRYILQPETDRVLVSIPGHRTSEFMAAKDPSDPNHLVAAGIDWDQNRGLWTCVAFVSRDGGRSWKGGPVIPIVDGHLQGDPWVTIDEDGNAHFVCLDFEVRDNGGARVLYSRSDDGGISWGEAVQVAPRDDDHSVDRAGILAGPDGALAVCTNEYDFEDQFSAPIFDGLAVATSTNGGETWSKTEQVTKNYAACRAVDVAPNGDMYLGFGVLRDDFLSLGVVRSQNGGRTWSQPLVSKVETYFGSMAVSPRTGHLFLATSSRDSSSVDIVRSSDHGRCYKSVKIPGIPTTCSSCVYVLRAVNAINSRGDLGVVVQIGDRAPENGTYDTSLNKEVWLLVSRDEGRSWLTPLRIAATGPTQSYLNPRTYTPSLASWLNHLQGAASDPAAVETNLWGTIGPIQRTDHLLNGGDYWGMTTSGDAFIPMWFDHFDGIPQIWAARVEIRGAVEGRGSTSLRAQAL